MEHFATMEVSEMLLRPCQKVLVGIVKQEQNSKVLMPQNPEVTKCQKSRVKRGKGQTNKTETSKVER